MAECMEPERKKKKEEKKKATECDSIIAKNHGECCLFRSRLDQGMNRDERLSVEEN